MSDPTRAYRPDIDGLRAVAVLPVVAFHMGIAAVPGGFVGVDVFFVISGYLIAGLLMNDLREGAFSIATFYQRRILRIFPALAAMLIAVCLVAATVLRPTEAMEIGRSTFAAALFYSNIFFWKTSGYFEDQAEQNPLLHTWSLAVEEQFYVFFPLMLYAIWRWGRGRYAGWFAGVALASFVLSIAGLVYEPTATFYLLPTRAWELLLGALIAAGAAPVVASPALRGGLAAGGLAMLLASNFLLSGDMPFPGWNALWPCLGAGLLIAYAPGTAAGRVLSWRPMVAVGLISYSLYLWHWPVIVFWRRFMGGEIEGAGLAAVAALSLVLAGASYALVERPFRAGRLRRLPSWRVVGAGAAVVLLLGGLGNSVRWRAEGAQDYPPEIRKIVDFNRYGRSEQYAYQFRFGTCMVVSGEGRLGDYKPDICLKTAPGVGNYLVLGDSHAAHIWRALSLTYPADNFLQATSTGCRPIRGDWGKSPCTDIMDYVFDDFLPRTRLDGVILAARWKDEDLATLPATIAYLRRYAGEVVVLGPAPKYNERLPLLIAESRVYGDPTIASGEIDRGRKRLSDAMRPVVEAAGAVYVPLYDINCPAGRCIEQTPDGTPVQFDRDHFTLAGARMVAEGIRSLWQPRPAVSAAGSRPPG
ncbi:acyltransferase family protein [Ancylobacter terrae]|uniref:acyltransferase family protein n=1 Tax=Ancylobacter sp. sgz301288 TaxID=3342077 RepID=UPI0038585ED0